MPKVKDIVAELSENFDPDDNIAIIYWTEGDIDICLDEVEQVEEDNDPRPFTEHEIMAIMDGMQYRINKVAITWDDLKDEIDAVVEGRG